MKQTVMSVAICLLLLNSRGVQASTYASNDLSRLEPQYMVQTNGMLSVCALDHSRGVLLRLKGLEISRSQLSRYNRSCVYEIGERPSASANSWKMPKDYHHFYGKIPYPVEDVDPSLSSHWNKKRELLIGVQLRNRFYAIKNLGEVQKNAAARKVIEIQPPLDVVNVKLPQHRTNDVDIVSTKARAMYILSEDD